jgi:hypothetical protein
MNTSIASKIPTTATLSRVIDLPNFIRSQQSQTNENISNEIVNNIIGNTKFEDYLKDLIEGIIFNQSIKNITNASTIDDPFDAIYIADLKPDYIQKKYIETLKYFASIIVDKSDEFQINDDWDD